MASKSLTFNLFGNDRTASKAIRGVGAQADFLGKGFKRLGAAILSAFAVTRIVNFGKTMVTEFAAAEAAQLRLSDAFARFPALADSTQQALQNLNNELMRKTRFDDDALASGQAVLAQYQLTGKQLEELTPLLADYAAKTGVDVTTAADQLGKALLGQGRALKAVGIDFEDAGSITANYEQLLAGLRTQVGGFATGEGQTLAVRLEILKNGFGELKESVGELFAPAVSSLSDLIYDRLIPALDNLVARVGPNVQKFFEENGERVGRFVDALSEMIETGSAQPLIDLFDDLAKTSPLFAILATTIETLQPVMPVLAEAFAEIGRTLTEEGVLESLSELVVNLLPPLTELLIAISPLIPPIADFLTTVLVPALQLAGSNISMISILLDLLKGDLSAEEFMRAVEDLPIVGDAFKFLGDTLVNVQNTIAGAFNGMIGAIEGAVNGVRFLMGMGSIKLPRVAMASTAMWRTDMSNTRFGSYDATKFADGGLVRATPGGTLGVIGEAGHDEAVIPMTPQVMREIGAGFAQAAGGVGGSTINVYTNDPWTAARLVANRLGGGMAVLRG